jgi:hypothetical protein
MPFGRLLTPLQLPVTILASAAEYGRPGYLIKRSNV